jgi:bifunctional non-homologous end joining protein LigD
MAANDDLKATSLYYRNGSSDKVYRAWIEAAQSGGYHVLVAWGRRGSALSTGTKTSAPVDYEAAVAVLDKLIAAKKGKGYGEGEDGTPYQHSGRAVSGLLPQLLNTVEDSAVSRLLDDPAWWMQEKYDGRRLLLRKNGTEVEAINKLGLVVGVPLLLVDAARELPGDFTLDGELVGDQLRAFDVIGCGGVDLVERAYRERYAALTELLKVDSGQPLSAVPCWTDPLDKDEWLTRLRGRSAEGVVFKRWDAPYTIGRPNSGGSQLKHKFIATCSALVTAVNRQRSVGVSLLGDTGWESVGNVTIPSNHSTPSVGSVIEVRYLYAHEGGSLFQPVYLGERTDVEAHECITAQLKFKAS